MGEKVSAEFLNFGVFAKQSLSQSSSPSIVGSESEHSDPLANIASAQHLEKHDDTSTNPKRSVQLANKFGLEEVTPTEISESASEIDRSTEEEVTSIKIPDRQDDLATDAPDETRGTEGILPQPDPTLRPLLAIMAGGFVGIGTTAILLITGALKEVPNLAAAVGGVGGLSLLVAFVFLVILVARHLQPAASPAATPVAPPVLAAPPSQAVAPRLVLPLTQAEAAMYEARQAQRLKVESEHRVTLAVGSSIACLSAGAAIAAGVTSTMPEIAPVLTPFSGTGAGVLALAALWVLWDYFQARGLVRQIEENMT
jgi:hypothetical protein